MFNELKIENFRGFASLELKDLKRVNLIVGENNAGKTSMLEAITMLCEPDFKAGAGRFPGLFRDWPINADRDYFRWLLRDSTKQGSLCASRNGKQNFLWISDGAGPIQYSGTVLHTNLTHMYGGAVTVMRDDSTVWTHATYRIISIRQRDIRSLVGAVGKAHRKSHGEETLQKLLAGVDPRITKVRIDPGEDGSTSNQQNQVIIDIGLRELVPITQVGQGVCRLLTILGDIIGDQPDVLLIDEIENGLHHSVHKQIWTGLAEAAAALNVQIFATTHSDEFLRSAHAACASRDNYDFSVIQLFRVAGGVQGRVLDQKLIEAALAGNIDLRS